MENEDEGKLKRRDKRRGLLHGLLYGTPQSKALYSALIESQLEMIDLHTEQIRELQSRVEPNATRIIDKLDGVFYYDGEPLKKLKNKDTLYWVIFDTVFGLMSNGGFKTYSEIEKELKGKRANGRKLPHFTGAKSQKRIRQNLTSEKNGFFRYAGIGNSTGDGRAIIETQKGKGITFNNARA